MPSFCIRSLFMICGDTINPTGSLHENIILKIAFMHEFKRIVADPMRNTFLTFLKKVTGVRRVINHRF